MDIGTLMPHLLGVPVWGGGALASEGERYPMSSAPGHPSVMSGGGVLDVT
jgi:hypothetical protein